MIVVTGATGQLGRLIVEKLIERIPPDQIVVSVRDPKKAGDLEALGVRVRQGDFNDPGSLRHAFEGATQVLVVSSNARASGGNPLAQHHTAIDAAKAVGVRRIVYTSHMAASASSAFPPARDHAATEEMLRQSGLAWTALRHGFYAQSGLMMNGEGLKTGVIEAPLDGKVSWTTHADLAEADAILLTNEGRYDGPTPPLTASQAIDLDELAIIASDVLGKPVVRKLLTDGEFTAKMIAHGAPEGAAKFALGLYVASRNGEFTAVDPTLERLLGRRPASMRELLASNDKLTQQNSEKNESNTN
jgi:NAD(P)H dehydrogenase (quinone)